MHRSCALSPAHCNVPVPATPRFPAFPSLATGFFSVVPLTSDSTYRRIYQQIGSYQALLEQDRLFTSLSTNWPSTCHTMKLLVDRYAKRSEGRLVDSNAAAFLS